MRLLDIAAIAAMSAPAQNRQRQNFCKLNQLIDVYKLIYHMGRFPARTDAGHLAVPAVDLFQGIFGRVAVFAPQPWYSNRL